MSTQFPLISLGLVLSAFVPSAPAARRVEDRLLCSYSGSYFRVTDGVRKWEKYVGNWDRKEAKLECGEKIAAGLIGSYFVFFSDGKIQTQYVGSFAEDRRMVALAGDLAAAIDGAYFMSARAGGQIVEKFVGNAAEPPMIAISPKFAAAVMSTRFVVTDGLKTEDRYIGGGTDAKIIANADLAAALTGNYFVAYVNGQIKELYVGSRDVSDTLTAGQSLIAASMGKYFVVLDGKRGEIKQHYTGAPGKVQVIRDIAVHESAPGRLTRYNGVTGSFQE